MSKRKYSTKLVGVTLALSAIGAACGGDDSSSGSVESWCGFMDEANEVDTLFDSLGTADTAQVKTAIDRISEILPRLESAAPPEIKADAKTLADSTSGVVDAIEAADYSLIDADLSAVLDSAQSARVDAAQDNLDAFSVRECGQPFGSDDSNDGVGDDTGDGTSPDGESDDSSFDPASGSIRDQLVTQFVTLGFSQQEAQCIADGVDPSNPDFLSGEAEAVLALFESCDIPLSRLAEIGAG